MVDANDKALLVAIAAAMILIWQWGGNEALKRENERLQSQLQQTQLQLQSFREGVLSR